MTPSPDDPPVTVAPSEGPDVTADPVDAFVAVCPTAVLIVDQGGRILTASPAAVELFGQGGLALVGRPLDVLLPGLLPEEGDDAAPPQPLSFVDARGVAADGAQIDVCVSLREVPSPGATRYGVFVEHRAASAATALALRESERQFRDVVEGTDDLVTKVDAAGRYLYVNHSAERIFGLRPEECVGLDAFQFVHPDDRASAQQQYREWLAERGHTATFENRSINRAGEVRLMLWTVNARYSETGEFLGTWSIARDITHRQALEEAERRHLEAQVQLGAERARAEFRREVLARSIAAQEEERRRIASELHHESGQSLLQVTLRLRRVEIAEDLEAAGREARAAQREVNRAITDLQRIAGALRPAALEDLGLGRAVEQLVADASAAMPVSISVEELPRRLDPAVETVIYRVLQQALTNAISHSRARQVRVWLAYRNGSVTAVVDDNGRGFQEAALDVPAAGLAGMRERAGAVGGRLSIESSPGSGTRVRLDVPADKALGADAGTITVLVAGSQPIGRIGLRRMLESHEGVEVVAEAQDLRDVVRKVRAHRPSVLVLDPDSWSETATLEAIADAAAAWRHTGVVVLSSADDPAVVRELLRGGASGYLLKDAEPSELLDAVQRAAEGVRYLQPELGARLSQLDEAELDPTSALSDREVEVLRLLALGHTNQEIAGELYLSVRTVEAHRTHIQQKLRLGSRAELVRYALEHRLLRV